MREIVIPPPLLLQGFTLAEILITLVIISVIAAFTIPTLINNTQKQEFVSGLKKSYSTFKTVTNQIIAEEGSALNWASSADNIYNLYKKHLSFAKECGGSTGCFTSGTKRLDNGEHYNNLDTDNSIRKLILADGSQVAFFYIDSTCSDYGSGTNNRCAYIFVDLNGDKKPNRYGRDTFLFALKENGLYPGGCDYNHCLGTEGWGCACKVLRENAMNY